MLEQPLLKGSYCGVSSVRHQLTMSALSIFMTYSRIIVKNCGNWLSLLTVKKEILKIAGEIFFDGV